MGYDEFILLINTTSIIILLVMAFLLCSAAKFKGESSYAALIIVFTTIPIYSYNTCIGMEWFDVAIYIAPFAFSINLTLMPLLWSLTQRGFNPGYRFTPKKILHYLPAILSLIFFCIYIFSLPKNECYYHIINKNLSNGTWLDNVNFVFLSVQVISYFIAIFRYLHKVKHYVRDYYSKAELASKVWIPRFIVLFAILFVIMMVCYVISPHTDTWLLQLLNVIAMGYLLYSELETALSYRFFKEPTSDVIAEAEADFSSTLTEKQSKNNNSNEDMEQLLQYAQQVEEYLQTSEAYVNPNLSLRDVSKSTGISYNNISKSINIILLKNFFDLVNGFRVEKSKALLLMKKKKGLTLETIAEQCGFNSQVTYCNAFKKATGMTTTQWLKDSSTSSYK